MNRTRLASYIFLAGLLLMAASLPLSMFGMSLSQFILLAGWLISGKTRDNLRKAFTNPVTIVLTGVFLIHLAGTFYSTDFDYAFKDMRIKLPLLLLPVMFSTAPVNVHRHTDIVLRVLVAAVLTSTFISVGVLYGWMPHEKPVNDIRDAAVFISHIRLALLVCFSIFYLAWQTTRTEKMILRIAYTALTCWLVYFLYVMESMTGILILVPGAMAMVVRYAIARHRAIPAVAVLILAPALLITYIFIEPIPVINMIRLFFISSTNHI